MFSKTKNKDNSEKEGKDKGSLEKDSEKGKRGRSSWRLNGRKGSHLKAPRKAVLVGTFLIVLVGLNIFLFYNTGRFSYEGISGNLVNDDAPLPLDLSLSTIAFIFQWVVLLVIASFVYFGFSKRKRREMNLVLSNTHLIYTGSRSETSIGVLYNLLKKEKKLGVKVVSKLFNISGKKAFEWAKILESDDLVSIEYPVFSGPEMVLKGKKDFEKVDSKGKGSGKGKTRKHLKKEVKDEKEKAKTRGKSGEMVAKEKKKKGFKALPSEKKKTSK